MKSNGLAKAFPLTYTERMGSKDKGKKETKKPPKPKPKATPGIRKIEGANQAAFRNIKESSGNG